MITTPRSSAHMKVTELFFYLGRNYSWNDNFYQSRQKHVFRILKSLKFLFLEPGITLNMNSETTI